MFNGLLKEPAAMIVFYSAFSAVGVVFFMLTKKGIDSGAEGALMAGIVMLVAFCGLGLVGVGIGVRRLQWKRTYVDIMGHSPFQSE
jgi:hypothetical protein